ncbi:hypothetical protein B0J14DRAFT_469832 [Halenospora varia]|nr:hypothetical protein B0J14DRAFT_469832 [Halenospora varia]
MLHVTFATITFTFHPAVSEEKLIPNSQGSTRSTVKEDSPLSFASYLTAPSKPPKRFPNTRLVWSLEENPQQDSGLPREFTFVF